MKKLTWKVKWEEKSCYPIQTIAKPVTNLKAYENVNHIRDIRGEYYWMNKGTRHLTHRLFLDRNSYNSIEIKAIQRMISKGMIWQKKEVRKQEEDNSQIKMF